MADYLSRSQADAELLQATAEALVELMKATDGWLYERMQPHLVKVQTALARSRE